jgi:ABC-type transporter Mla MlaB component
MSDNLLLDRDLLLANFSEQTYPAIETYTTLKTLDLSQLTNVDSAGVAYLIQIKMRYPALHLVNASAKLRVLSELYGVENFFEK